MCNHIRDTFFLGDELRMFRELRIDRNTFEDLVNAVADLPLQRRGRRAFVFSHRERVLFIHVFLSFGLNVTHTLLLPRIKSTSEVGAMARRIATEYADRMRAVFITHRNAPRNDQGRACFVIDCTVVQTKRPCLPFEEAKNWFSGKHYIYCLKKEVVVNASDGTAAFVESAFPGSVHDLTILRRGANNVLQVTGDAPILADKGYRGGETNVRTLIVVTEQSPAALRNRRVVVECFFGRLKSKFTTFSRKWVQDEPWFDLFFDLACCFTNADILYHPLDDDEWEIHQSIIEYWRLVEEERLRRRAAINARYRERLETAFIAAVASFPPHGFWQNLEP